MPLTASWGGAGDWSKTSTVAPWLVPSVAVGTAIFSLFYLHQRLYAVQRAKNAPPGAFGWPILGESLEYIRGPMAFAFARRKRHAGAFSTHYLFSPMVLVGLDDNSSVMRAEVKGLTTTSVPMHLALLLGATSIFNVTGAGHAKLRRILGAAFTPEAARSQFPVVDECVMNTLQNSAARCAKGEVLNTIELKTLALMTFLRTTVSDVSEEECNEICRDFVTWLKGIEVLIPYPLPFTRLRAGMKARERLLERFRVLMERYERNGASEKAKNSMFARILESRKLNGELLTTEEVLDNVLGVAFAGHDTTYCTFATIIAILYDPKHAVYLKRLREELDTVCPLGKELEYADIRNAPYLNAVMHEIWRFAPPVIGAFRQVVGDDLVLSNGAVVPEGWKVSYTLDVHYDKEFWGPKAGVFDPETYLVKADDRNLIKYWAPFGGGNRPCLGQELARVEIRVFLARLVQLYEVEVRKVEPINFPLMTYSVDYVITPRKD